MGPTDDRLERARRGDDGALEELLREHAGEARRAVAGRVPERLRSVLSEEDVLQETYTDAFLAIARFEPVGDGAFGAWLRTLARNNLRDAIRALEADKRGGAVRARRGGSLDALVAELAERTGASPGAAAGRAETAAAVRAAVERLPEAHARVVRAHDLEGRPIEAIAAELGRSPGAVWLLRNRALKRLVELLGELVALLQRRPVTRRAEPNERRGAPRRSSGTPRALLSAPVARLRARGGISGSAPPPRSGVAPARTERPYARSSHGPQLFTPSL